MDIYVYISGSIYFYIERQSVYGEIEVNLPNLKAANIYIYIFTNDIFRKLCL